MANVGTGEAVTAETRFSVGSLTKSMVATVIAALADAGRLSLDDPVSAHVPELRGGGWAERATVLDLLANRSGLPLRAALEFGFAAHRDTDDGALARLIAEIDADLPASAVWSYTNVGWCVLGRVIETVTGDTWEAAMRHLLFDRAGMTSTTFATGSEPVRRVAGHDITPGGAVAVEPLVARAYGPAGTSVVSTVTDLLRFAGLHLEDPSLAALRVVQADVSIHGWFDAWCLGWARFDWEGGNVWGWDGLISGERSALRIVPEHDAAIVLLTNSSTGRALYRTLFAELMRTALRDQGPATPPRPITRQRGRPRPLRRRLRMARPRDRGHGRPSAVSACGRRDGKPRRSRSMTVSSLSTPSIRTTPR